ncbi:transglutaminase domain-containing protein [Olsenella sp. DSM 107455]|uniref:Transglutaminase domain-containing protein n=1 Tax=Thermophilibacter gallinarum TaxID=2779357 RepID=A0ABR9QQJ3_9ACTN|nr:transglutaminase domain-containing protein [Thermophilibacter gallinarum]
MRFPRKRGVAAIALTCALSLAACSGGSSGSAGGFDPGTTSGPAWTMPTAALLSPFSADAVSAAEPVVDLSHASEGYVAASATSDARLKLQVVCGEMSYNYDLPSDGSPIVVPLNMGDGAYRVRVMQNTSGNNYVEVYSVGADVELESEFAPYLRPNLFCDYDDSSAAVAKARELAAGAENEGDVMRDVCIWVASNITYDYDKAAELSGTSGYVPSPDETLASGTGICFDYASLSAAMLRSLGIPCKVVTGYVSPDGVYHAWNLVYINGSWTSVEFSVREGEWSRVDLTFAAAGAGDTVGDGTSYTDRYVY